MSRRPPTPAEVAASIVFHDRYVAQRNGAIEFWSTLTAAEQDLIDHLVRAVVEAIERPDGSPRCPKRCDVATRPEAVAPGRWVCVACGTEFTWPPDDPDNDDAAQTVRAVDVAAIVNAAAPRAPMPANVVPFPSLETVDT